MEIKNQEIIRPITFEPIQNEWMYISDNAVYGIIANRYIINIYGQIFDTFTGLYVEPTLDKEGYLVVGLSTYRGMLICRLHRVLMMTFRYFPGCDTEYIVFKNKIKTYCFLSNLEWKEKSVYSNLFETVENSEMSNKIHEICKLLQDDNYTLPEISKITGFSVPQIRSIQNKSCYKEISSLYNFPVRKVISNLNNAQIVRLCEYFENNPKGGTIAKVHCTEALKNIGIDSPSDQEIRTAYKILTKQAYTNISKDYKF